MENTKKNTHYFQHERSGGTQTIVYDPTSCPHCHATISPKGIYFSTLINAENVHDGYVSLFQCPHCYMPFIAFHKKAGTAPNFVAPTIPVTHTPPKHVSTLSPDFVKIHQEAQIAEAYGLSEICGMGYRKALEFLIKDYLINTVGEDAETIRKMELNNCISNKVTNEGLKTLAQRATWLGNDFTHYTRKFEEYELDDLKRFLDATIQWINMELTIREAEAITRR